MKMEGSATTGSRGELRTFQVSSSQHRRAAPPFSDDRTRESRRQTSSISPSVRAGRRGQKTRTLDDPILLPLNLYYSLASNGWTSGETYRVRLFDPMTLTEGEATIEVKDPEIRALGAGTKKKRFRLQTTFAGLTTTAWVNDYG